MGVETDHPDYENYAETWQFIRDSMAGEEVMKREAGERDYIMVPEAMQSYGADRPQWQYVSSNREAVAYVERARYPEVCLRAVDMAVGKAFSRDPQINGPDNLIAEINTLWADGEDFETGVMNLFREGLTTRNGGLFINPDESGAAVIRYYPAEAVRNWKLHKGVLRLVVLEDSEPAEDVFSHETRAARIVLGLDEQGRYYSERWLESVNNGDVDWLLEGKREYPTMLGSTLDYIPFVPLAGWKINQPPFKPLAKTSLSYFRASAEYAHIMWWSATPQPYISFGETGGFYGVGEFDAASAAGDGEAADHNIEIQWGSSTPILLRDGQINFADAPSGALGAHEQRMQSLREEMSGLGARAFQNEANGNQTAETERMQQAGEGAVVWLVMREVAKAVSRAVQIAGAWRMIADSDLFEFEFNRDISFEPFDLNPVSGLTQLHLDGYIRRKDVRRFLRKVDAIEPGVSDEELDEEIAEERAQLQAMQQPDPNQLPPDEFDAGVSPDEELPALDEELTELETDGEVLDDAA